MEAQCLLFSKKSGMRTPCARSRTARRSSSSALHLIHEVTSPQAFDMLREHGWRCRIRSAPSPRSTTSCPPARRSARSSTSLAEEMMSALRAELPRVRHSAVRARRRPRRQAGHRARRRTRAGAHPAGHDHRVRRQPHLHARRLWRDRVRHRHHAGARRARHADAGDGPAEGAPHRRQRHAAAGRLRQGRHPHIIRQLGVQGGVGYAYEYGGRRSTACRWKSA